MIGAFGAQSEHHCENSDRNGQASKSGWLSTHLIQLTNENEFYHRHQIALLSFEGKARNASDLGNAQSTTMTKVSWRFANNCQERLTGLSGNAREKFYRSSWIANDAGGKRRR